MSSKIFSQPPLSVAAQLELLRGRNLVIDDEEQAKHYLQTIGYYRLMMYAQPFRVDPENENEKNFAENTTFSQILRLYIFDRELRVLISDALERIEIAFRVAISNVMSLTHKDAQWYLNRNLFFDYEPQRKRKNKRKKNKNNKEGEENKDKKRSTFSYESLMEEIHKHINRSKENFIKDYLKTYDSPKYPPTWMIMECLSFGMVSKIYSNLKEVTCRKLIAEHFKQSHKTVKSWMRSLSLTRNICAHHGYLWNRKFENSAKDPDAPRNAKKDEEDFPFDRNRFVMQAYIIIQLLDVISPNHHWKTSLKKLFEKHEGNFFPDEMGFPTDWKSSPLWTVQHHDKKMIHKPQLLSV